MTNRGQGHTRTLRAVKRPNNHRPNALFFTMALLRFSAVCDGKPDRDGDDGGGNAQGISIAGGLCTLKVEQLLHTGADNALGMPSRSHCDVYPDS